MRCFLVVCAFAAGCAVTLGPRRVDVYGDQLRARASFDMQCPRDALEVIELDASTAGVTGCGQRGTYVFSAATSSWVLNSPGAPTPPFEVPPPPPEVTTPGAPAGTPPGMLPGAPPGSPPGTSLGGPPH